MEEKVFHALTRQIADLIRTDSELSLLSNEDLREKIDEIVEHNIQGIYLSINQRIQMTEQIFSSVRGLGMLDGILSDDSIKGRKGI